MQKQVEPSLKAFAEEVYYKSKEFGIYDVRTSIAFYNLSHVFHHLNQVDHALAFWDVVIYSWRVALQEVVLGVIPSRELPWGKKEFEGMNPEHLNTKQAIATLQMTEVCDLIQVDSWFKTFFPHVKRKKNVRNGGRAIETLFFWTKHYKKNESW